MSTDDGSPRGGGAFNGRSEDYGPGGPYGPHPGCGCGWVLFFVLAGILLGGVWLLS